MANKPEYVEISRTEDSANGEVTPELCFYLAPDLLQWIMEEQGLCRSCAQRVAQHLKSVPFHNSRAQNS